MHVSDHYVHFCQIDFTRLKDKSRDKRIEDTDESEGIIRNKLFGLDKTAEVSQGPITFVQHDLDDDVSTNHENNAMKYNSDNPVLTLLYRHKKRNMESLTASVMILFFMPAVALIAYASIYQRQCDYECTCSAITGIYGVMNLLTSAVLLLLRLYHYANATSLNHEKMTKAVLIIIHIGFEVLFAVYTYKLYLIEKTVPNHTWKSNLAVSFVFKIVLALNMLQIIYFLYSEKKLFDYENLLRVLTKDCNTNNNDATIREVYYLPGVTDDELARM